MDRPMNESDFIFYRGEDGNVHAQVILGDDTVWISQIGMAGIFGIDRTGIGKHIKNIFAEKELIEKSVSAKIAHAANDGKVYDTTFYSLDLIIAVGYRVNSYKATKFRQWSTRILQEYLTKGFVLDDERLKQGNKLFGKDHFRELLERIREIRTSERMFYEKITDLYALSEDYDKVDPQTKVFFAKVQNKLEFAITGKTSAEIIKSRVNANMPNMGLKSWKNSKRDGKILKTDVTIGKNYLSQEELKSLNLLVSSFLDHAEMLADRNKVMKMSDWSDRLDKFLEFNLFKVLKDAGSIRRNVADAFAEREFEKFRVQQDGDYRSDFNNFVDSIKSGNNLPKEGAFLNPSPVEPLSDFDEKLKTALNFNPKENKVSKKPKANKIKGKVCPLCGAVNDENAKYCSADYVDDNGDIIHCGHSFIAIEGKDQWE